MKNAIKCKKLYHISETNHDGETFKPRVPESIIKTYGCDGYYNEDDKTKRICFSKSITGAYYGIEFNGGYNDYYVHIPLKLEELCDKGVVVRPTEEQVYDVNFTDEVWVRNKVKMKCIGKARIGAKEPTYYDDRPKVHIKWIERYA